MPQPKEYKHIRAWGKMLQSFEYYIVNEQRIASEDNAPLTAIYKRKGEWITSDDLDPNHVFWKILETVK